MCDYCDCRSIKIIEGLSEDHEVVHELSRSLKGAIELGDYAAANAVRPQLGAFLTVHGLKEELSVYQLVADEVPGKIELLTQEHRDTDLVLSQPITDEASAGRVLQELRNLREHIDDEEHDLFPFAHQAVNPQAWEVAEVRIQAALADLATLTD